MTNFHGLDDRELLGILIRKSSDFTENELAVLRQELRARGYDTDRTYDIRKAYFADSELGYICGTCGEKMYVQGEELWIGKTECPYCKEGQDIVVSSLESINMESKTEKPAQAQADGVVRFPAVKTLSDVLRVLAWLISIVAAGFGVYALSKGVLFTGIGLIVFGAVLLLINLALAEVLMVLLAIEENTRMRARE